MVPIDSPGRFHIRLPLTPSWYVTVYEIFDIKSIFPYDASPKVSYTGSKLTRMRLLLPVLLAIGLTLRCEMFDLHFQFEEDRTITAVAIDSDKYFGETNRRTDRQTDEHSSNFISVQCHALH